jgi:hypothetical protein
MPVALSCSRQHPGSIRDAQRTIASGWQTLLPATELPEKKFWRISYPLLFGQKTGDGVAHN